MHHITTLLVFMSVLFAYQCDDAPVIKETPDPQENTFTDTLRFASYNVALFESSAGILLPKLQNSQQDIRLQKIKAVVQKNAPDVLVLMEIDYDSTGEIINAFNAMLETPAADGLEGIQYEYLYQIESNTGQLSEVDLDDDGTINLPNDAYGFGNYDGQYASAILSKYPLATNEARSFKDMLWKDMPAANLPTNSDGSSFYSSEAIDVFRLSSKNHIDIPVLLPDGRKIHALISHPTPPVFDGAEDRNGKRNHDEIKLWADYISNASYLIDDNGMQGGLGEQELFVLFGDQNADPIDGDSYNNAMLQILEHDRVHKEVASGALIPSSQGGEEHNQQSGDTADPKYDTSFFGLRIDYVLPSDNLSPIASGVFWPAEGQEGYEWIRDSGASDHLMVWLDISFE